MATKIRTEARLRAQSAHHVSTPATRRAWRTSSRVASARVQARLTRGIDRSTAPEYAPRVYLNVTAPSV